MTSCLIPLILKKRLKIKLSCRNDDKKCLFLFNYAFRQKFVSRLLLKISAKNIHETRVRGSPNFPSGIARCLRIKQ